MKPPIAWAQLHMSAIVRPSPVSLKGGLCSTMSNALGSRQISPPDSYFSEIQGDVFQALQSRAVVERTHAETLDRVRVLALIGSFYTKSKDPHVRKIYEGMLSLSSDQAARTKDPVHHTEAMNVFIDSLIYEIVAWRPKTQELIHPLRQALGDQFETRSAVILEYLNHR